MPFISSNNELFNDENSKTSYNAYKKKLYVQAENITYWLSELETISTQKLKNNDIHYDAFNAYLNSQKAKGHLATKVLLPMQFELHEYVLKQYSPLTERNKSAAADLLERLNKILFDAVLENHEVIIEDKELSLAFIAVSPDIIEAKLRQTHDLSDEALISGFMKCRQDFATILGEHHLYLTNTMEIAGRLSEEQQESLLARLGGINLIREKVETIVGLTKLPSGPGLFATQLAQSLAATAAEMKSLLDMVFSEDFLVIEDVNKAAMSPS